MLEFRFMAERASKKEVHVYGSIFFNYTENEPNLIDIVECIEAYTSNVFQLEIKLDYDMEPCQGIK